MRSGCRPRRGGRPCHRPPPTSPMPASSIRYALLASASLAGDEPDRCHALPHRCDVEGVRRAHRAGAVRIVTLVAASCHARPSPALASTEQRFVGKPEGLAAMAFGAKAHCHRLRDARGSGEGQIDQDGPVRAGNADRRLGGRVPGGRGAAAAWRHISAPPIELPIRILADNEEGREDGRAGQRPSASRLANRP